MSAFRVYQHVCKKCKGIFLSEYINDEYCNEHEVKK